jgi:hypothetical protein
MSSTKKIERLVYAGMVLDERGAWIPIAEKLRKEKEFIHHLEQGEILIKGSWTRISDVSRPSENMGETKHIHRDDNEVVSEETTLDAFKTEEKIRPAALLTPEETVSFSTDTLRDFTPEIVSVKPDADFPPETRIFSIERPGHPPRRSTPADSSGHRDKRIAGDETQIEFSLNRSAGQTGPGGTTFPSGKQQPMANDEPEFEETVLYNIKVLKQQNSLKKGRDAKPGAAPVRTSSPVKFAGSNDWEPDVPKQMKLPVVIIILTVAILLLFIAFNLVVIH